MSVYDKLFMWPRELKAFHDFGLLDIREVEDKKRDE